MNNNQPCKAVPRGGRPRSAALLLLGIAFVAQGAVTARAQDGPTVIPALVHVTIFQNAGFWAPGAKDADYTTTSWFPNVDFRVRGPVPGGSQFAVEFTRPDASLWARINCETEEIAADAQSHITMPTPSRPEGEKKYTKAIGVFGFKIRCRNAIAGKDEVLFSGKFKVGKKDASLGIPKFKNKFNFYIDHDWALPIGYVWFHDSGDNIIPPRLAVTTWLKGDAGNYGEVTGYLFYKGKQIASTKDPGGAAEEETEVNTTSNDKGDPTWRQYYFEWQVMQTNSKPDEQFHAFYLDKNPGEYEAKVLRDGKLCRTIKFTVGEDGKVVGNSIATDNKLGIDRIVVSVQVMGTTDGTWNKTAWKTDAFYGNPLQGFTAP